MDIKPVGPWVWLRVNKPKKKRGRLYLPDGNMAQILGHSTAEVLSIGSGKLTKKGARVPTGIEPGDTVVFRGYLKIIHQPDFDNLDRCLVHVDDIAGVVNP